MTVMGLVLVGDTDGGRPHLELKEKELMCRCATGVLARASEHSDQPRSTQLVVECAADILRAAGSRAADEITKYGGDQSFEQYVSCIVSAQIFLLELVAVPDFVRKQIVKVSGEFTKYVADCWDFLSAEDNMPTSGAEEHNYKRPEELKAPVALLVDGSRQHDERDRAQDQFL